MKAVTSTKLFLLLLCLMATSVVAHAQEAPAKFGKIEESELKMLTYDKDTSAAAVVLSDVGNTYFTYYKGFQFVFERQTRIKILKKSGYDWANISIPFYQKNASKEKVINIKGFTYNLVDGKVVKEKLEGKAIFDEQTSEYWFTKKFTMPNVKEGSVIEFSYTITSDFLYNLREWEFQDFIPIAYSQYKVRIPEYFNYKLNQQGYLRFSDESKTERGREKFTVTWEASIDAGLGGGRTPGGSTQVEAENVTHLWVVKDAPALRPESFITTMRDYQTKLEFELQTVKYPGEIPRVMTGNWDEVTVDLMKSENFGTQLRRNGFFKNEIAAIAAKYTKPEEQIAAIHELVKKSVKWNGKYHYLTTGPIRKAFDNHIGNAADINILLTAMLLEAGLDAAPVLVSTREHGRPPLGSPMLNKFNYVLSHVKLGDYEVLLDATDPLLTAGMLPFRCLNGQGRLIKNGDNRWVDLKPTGQQTSFFTSTLTVSETGDMSGKATESNGGYNALFMRRVILEEGEDKFAEKMAKESGNYKIENAKVQNLTDLGKALELVYDIRVSGNGQKNSMLYINPMLSQAEKENPFKLEERLYPVDFAAPKDETYICTITIPDGFEVEESPKNAVVALPENGGRFMYVVEKNGNKIQILSKISISKPVFYAPEYASLKEFYNQIVAKHAEQIVLKKIAQN
ncbi:DUF3857 domain-containing protein [Pontibacter sp. SGAir0037]|uniref:DUF3857 domain-containing protein n=1 Tax=Pontibacter sp. SGAir0037 TaxID=2571030 RepID=UPI0010CD3158|nr:DUF3857 domain-containing protein [Pontibacter sp. SGAir0037]QCR24442.1 hypothetical protein C1N53_20155 [Pontibacter sp. SGAir0037]